MRVAVLTSGGDAPGMNGAIRAVTRTSLAEGWDVLGVEDGYAGLMDGRFRPLRSRDVGGILHLGGTVLGSARAPAMRTDEGQERALDAVARAGIDALIVIGGNGSQAGAHALSERGLQVVGIASTIDNDLAGSDITLGVDTALNVALESIDRLKTTAASHRRAFLVEVMGRDSGYLAMAVAVASGAEAVVVPEVDTSPEDVVAQLHAAYDRGNNHAVVIVAEGARYGTDELLAYAAQHEHEFGFGLRETILGHVQRGGDPTAFDRLLSSRFGAAAVQAVARDEHGVLVGLRDGDVTTIPLADVVGAQERLDVELADLLRLLTR